VIHWFVTRIKYAALRGVGEYGIIFYCRSYTVCTGSVKIKMERIRNNRSSTDNIPKWSRVKTNRTAVRSSSDHLGRLLAVEQADHYRRRRIETSKDVANTVVRAAWHGNVAIARVGERRAFGIRLNRFRNGRCCPAIVVAILLQSRSQISLLRWRTAVPFPSRQIIDWWKIILHYPRTVL